jgi:hypothetical protein
MQGKLFKLLTHKLVRSVLIRAGRTFLQTFIAVLLATPVLSLTLPTLEAAAVAGLASTLSMLHRLLDETPVPSLTDTTTPATRPAVASGVMG